MSQHVPAWKKLGLKLKYAKDTADNVEAQSAASPVSVTANGASESTFKRSRDEDGEHTNGHAKKRKTSSKSRAEPQHAKSTTTATPSDGLDVSLGDNDRTTPGPENGLSATSLATRSRNAESHDDHQTDQDNSKQIRNPNAKLNRKKSVTFTPETKEEDGESISAYFKAWSAEQQQPHTPPKPSTEGVAKSPSTPTIEPDTPVKSNAGSTPKPKEKKIKQKGTEKPSAQAKTAYLDYLNQFHNDKVNWKFNKSKQNDLLKNVWSVFRIPVSYNEALYGYVAGLQGQAARQRLASGAEDILKDLAEKTTGLPTAEEMEDPEARKDAYKRVVEKRIEDYETCKKRNEYDYEKLEEIRQAVEKEKRAEAILRQTLIRTLDPTWKPPPPPEKYDLLAQPPLTAEFTGKRMTFDDEPESAAPTNGALSKTPPKRKRKARINVESSSDSSSSSSESDSDEDPSSSDSEDDDDDSSTDDSSSEDDSSDEDGEQPKTNGYETSPPKRKAVFDSSLLDQAFPRTAERSKKSR